MPRRNPTNEVGIGDRNIRTLRTRLVDGRMLVMEVTSVKLAEVPCELK